MRRIRFLEILLVMALILLQFLIHWSGCRQSIKTISTIKKDFRVEGLPDINLNKIAAKIYEKIKPYNEGMNSLIFMNYKIITTSLLFIVSCTANDTKASK